MNYDLASILNGLTIDSVTIPTLKGKLKKELRGGVALVPKGQAMTLLEDTEVPALLYIVDKNNIVKFMTNKFYLTGAQLNRQEKAQIIETFGVPSFFFFGEKTKVYNFVGTLLETKSTSEKTNKYLWASSFSDLYENELRGTKLAKNGYEALLTFKNVSLRGFVVNLNISYNSNEQMSTPFSFSMIVRKETFSGAASTADLKSTYGINNWYTKDDNVINRMTELIEWVDEKDEKWDQTEINKIIGEAVINANIFDGRAVDEALGSTALALLKDSATHIEYIKDKLTFTGIGLNSSSGLSDKTRIDNSYSHSPTAIEFLEAMKQNQSDINEYNLLFDRIQTAYSGTED